MSNKVIRIGTRSSELAMWQANLVQSQLNALDIKSEIIKIDSKGDFVLDKPLYELGIVGVFTRNLDLAMLNGEIDIAVHSLKDVPTILPEGIVQAAVLERGGYKDILVFKDNEEFMSSPTATIATGSLRRQAQWLNRYPKHTIVGLRGNVNTRLKKLYDNEDWNGAIFAAAGLQRLKKTPKDHVVLSWMVPAPAQGVIMITALEKDTETVEIIKQLNHVETEICATIERQFLNTLEGGCTAPIGALAVIKEEEREIHFKGVLLSNDGKRKVEVSRSVKVTEHKDLGKSCAKELLMTGGQKLFLKEGVIEKERQFKVYATKELSAQQFDLFSDNVKAASSDFIRIRYNRLKPSLVKEPLAHVVITSQNAVEALVQNFGVNALQFTNIYCVGRRTKRLIEKKIGKVTQAENSAEKLADFLVKTIKDSAQITFFCGNLRRDVLPNILSENNKNLVEVEVYTTQETPFKLEGATDGVLFFSPSAVKSYVSVENPTNTTAFCIGATTEKEAKVSFEMVKTAKLPTVENVVKLVNETLK